MSDEQPQRPINHYLGAGPLDDNEPTPGRQDALRNAYEMNRAAGKSPYDGVPIRTLGELRWIMRERLWSGEEDPLPEGYGRANLSGANFRLSNLSGVRLAFANLRGTVLDSADLSGADLRATRMDEATELYHVVLDSTTRLADVVWSGAPLTRVYWERVQVLGDEQVAREPRDGRGKTKDGATRLAQYTDAVTANRQLATVLRSQGLNEHADRFAYHAQVLQREVLRRQEHSSRALFSWLLDALAGYGYKPERSLLAYLIAILGFGVAYYFIGQAVGPHLSSLGAFVFSMTSFHGRGFFPGGIALDDPITVLAALEAFVGLVIEVSFIATFTQRFFAR